MLDSEEKKDPNQQLLFQIPIYLYLIPVVLFLMGFLPMGSSSGRSLLIALLSALPAGIIGILLSAIGYFRTRDTTVYHPSSRGPLLMGLGLLLSVLGIFGISLIFMAFGLFM